jgi:4-diphosphocytidyl-2-C-methyl-D-erythritol kinase
VSPAAAASPGAAVQVRAHAKINLDLRVLGARADGYHELRTVFQTLALHDTLDCVARDGPFELECDTAGVPLDRSNLIWQAGDALWRAIGRDGPATDALVRVQKRIPVQGGLGGGSADAAAALLGLARIWRAPVGLDQLVDVAATLGADVAFFLSGGTALGLGRGDEIYPLVDLPRHWVVLLVPGFGVSSADAYRWYDAERTLDRATQPPEAQHVPGPWPSRAARMINDLEPPIARRHPEIAAMKGALRQAGALAAAMSGSGSTVFGLFQRRAEAVSAVRCLDSTPWRVLLTESIGRAAYGRRSEPRRLSLARSRKSQLH